MRKKQQVELVENVLEMHKDMNALTVDKINETPVHEPPIEVQLTKKQLAAQEGCMYIEPKKRLAPVGILPEKQRKQHAYDWEYVKGVLEHMEIRGEPISFWYCKYPGDPDCFWTIPCNKPVYVPRMIAKHLESTMKYHRFDYREKAPNELRPDAFMENFEPVETIWRAKFRAVEAFA